MSIGKGLDSIAVAFTVCGILLFVYMLLRGIALHDNMRAYEKSYRNENEAFCASLDGFYSTGKCYVDGKEVKNDH